MDAIKCLGILWFSTLPAVFPAGLAFSDSHKPEEKKIPAKKSAKPPGKVPEKTEEKTRPENTPESRDKLPSQDCRSDWAAPIGGPGYFNKTNEYYYHIANIGSASKRKRAGGGLFRYGIFQIDLNNARSNPLMTMKLPLAEVSIPFGVESLDAIITFVFNETGSSCLNGKARYIGFPVSNGKKGGKEKLSVIQGRGVIQLVETPDYPVAFDDEKNSLLEFDFNNLQSRSMLLRLEKQEMPVYYDIQRRRYYAWHFLDDKHQRGLVAYDGGGKVAGRLQFQGGDKMLQQKNFFGVARLMPSDNSLTIIELDRWSGQGGKKAYSIHIPKEYPVLDSSLKVHFSKKLAVISAFSPEDRMNWKKIYIYDYEKSWQLSELTSPTGQYIAYETISDDGRWIMAEIRKKSSGVTATLALFSIQTRKWVNITIVK